MYADARYHDSIDEDYINSFKGNSPNNSGKAANVPISLNVYGKQINGTIKIKTDDGITRYSLLDAQGNNLMHNGEGVKSLDDLKVSLISDSEFNQ